ncbi:MAG: glycoside hydrolase family 15 protein [Chloroflexi bacterium]|nr:glycoside hydrolase family 15 protein [Chloroflexota bacterium]
MARDLPLSNGNLLVNFDANYNVRDIFFPCIGQENHTAGATCRTGIWIDGCFFWIDDPAWEKSLGYVPDSLVTQVVARHREASVTLTFRDAVDFDRNIFVRQIHITNDAPTPREVRLFFHYDFHLYGVKIGDTVYYDAELESIVAFKEKRYFLMGGQAGNKVGIDGWSTGVAIEGEKGKEGTWRDAEDGVLDGNPIVGGSVDATIALHPGVLPPLGSATTYHWLIAGTSLDELRSLDMILRERGPQSLIVRTRDYWQTWVDKEELNFADLSSDIIELCKRSILIIRTQIDNRGPIIAATDGGITHFLRDTYSYMWPRDGAVVALALDHVGQGELSRRFFGFCAQVISRHGYLEQRYTPLGDQAAWHPRVDADGHPQLPIQEDETGLILYSLWEHYQRYRDIEFLGLLYRRLIKSAADFMVRYRDQRTGLPNPSYDLWEERRGIHAFTIAAVWAGLKAAANFCHLFREYGLENTYRQAAQEIKRAAATYLYDKELGRFVRTVNPRGDGTLERDYIIDSSLCGLFLLGMFPATDPLIESTIEAVRRRLWVKTAVGGLARYEGDCYHWASQDMWMVPGNPWFICTLWLARYYIAHAQTRDELAQAREILSWLVEHALPSGVLAEQINAYNGSPLSVSPLTWSHAEFVIAVREYVDKWHSLRGEETKGAVPAGPLETWLPQT